MNTYQTACAKGPPIIPIFFQHEPFFGDTKRHKSFTLMCMLLGKFFIAYLPPN